MRYRRVIGILVLICAATGAYAFSGDEHRLIARTGMQLAVNYCKARPEKCRLTPDQHVQLADFANPHSRLDYGTLVSSVDYRLNPLQLLQKIGDQTALPTLPADLDPSLVVLVTSGGTPFLRAASSNETHFQGDLIAGIRTWHANAVSVAAGTRSVKSGPEGTSETDVKGNLFAALLLNSISDHFLHDFFAPGHIITPRFGLHDAVALSIHNKYNTIGAQFEIDSERFKADLAELLEHLQVTPGLGEERFTRSAGDIGPGKLISLWGDTQLSRSPEQELFMILLQARSILDILQSAGGEPVNRFLALQWKPMMRRVEEGRSVVDFATAALPFGKYVHHRKGKHVPKAGTVLVFSGGAEMLLGVEGERDDSNDDKRTTARIVYAVETLVYGHLPSYADKHPTDPSLPVPIHFSAWRQYGINLGYTYAYNEHEQVHGPLARVVWALPLLHLQFSADVSEKQYSYKDQRARRTSYGLRAQTGFSLLLLDIGLAREWTYGIRGSLKPETAVRFGGSITGPLSSIPLLRQIEERFHRRQRPDYPH